MISALCFQVCITCVLCVCMCVTESTNTARCWQFSFIYLVVFFQHFFENFVCVGEIETEGAYVTVEMQKTLIYVEKAL